MVPAQVLLPSFLGIPVALVRTMSQLPPDHGDREEQTANEGDAFSKLPAVGRVPELGESDYRVTSEFHPLETGSAS